MVHWLWIPAALMIGAAFGILMVALCESGREEEKKKWWEE